MDVNGTEVVFRSNLSPQNEFTNETYFRQKWVFKRSMYNGTVTAYANGVNGKSFEGCQFKAISDERIHVTISGGKYLVLSTNF